MTQDGKEIVVLLMNHMLHKLIGLMSMESYYFAGYIMCQLRIITALPYGYRHGQMLS
jgi:hypothetical protein